MGAISRMVGLVLSWAETNVGVVMVVAVMVEVIVGVVITLLSASVAASSGSIMADSFLSSESGEACSHLTQKCSTRVDHKAVTEGKRFSYQSSATELDWQCK